jgi:hypothetical protein
MENLSRRTLTALAAAISVGCGSNDLTTSPSATPSTPSTATSAASPTPTPATSSASLPAAFAQFYGAQVSVDGSFVVLRATSVPDHGSPYFGTGNSGYEAPHAGMQVNPNRIASQSMVLRVPLSPQVATASDTPLGVMGVSVNGVALFNQYAAGRAPLTSEIQSFDRYNGHPQQSGMYHYHIEPVYLTAQGSSRLIGVLLDGFPVYGTRDPSGAAPTGLDTCNGHVGVTPEYPQGIYHYHIVASPPYIAGCFRGQPGTAS